MGLLERRGRNDYVFLKDKSDIKHDHLYYLYFKEGDDAIVEDVDEDGVEELQAVEETKNNKVRR